MLMAAARKAEWGHVEELLAARADADARGTHGVSALMLAAGKGSFGACALLLAGRADPNARDSTTGGTGS